MKGLSQRFHRIKREFFQGGTRRTNGGFGKIKGSSALDVANVKRNVRRPPQ